MFRFLLFSLSISLAWAQTPEPTIGIWRATGRLNEARYNACAARLPDGSALIAGGTGSGANLSSVEIYLPTEGVFVGGAPLNQPRAGHTCTVLQDGRVLVAGGDPDGTGSAEVFDPILRTWTLVEGTGTRLEGHTATLLQNGWVLLAVNSSLAVFDPSTNAIIPLAAQLASRRHDHAAALLPDGRVLLIGGQDSGFVFASVEVFDPINFTVTNGGFLNLGRAGHSATALEDGRVLVVGGLTNQRDTNSVEVFDPNTSRWTVHPSRLQDPRSGHLALFIPGNNGVLITGGTTDQRRLSSTEIFQLDTDAFLPTGELPLARTGMSGAVLKGGLILAMGGRNADGAQASCTLFNVPLVSFDKSVYLHPDTVSISGTGFPSSQFSVIPIVSLLSSGASTDIGSRLLTSTVPLVPGAQKGIVNFPNTAILATQVNDTGKQYRVTVRTNPSLLSATATSLVRSTTSISIVVPPPVFVNQPASFNVVLVRTVDAGPVTGTVTIAFKDFSSSAGSTQTFALPGVSSNIQNHAFEQTFGIASRKTIIATYAGDALYAGSTATIQYDVAVPRPNVDLTFSPSSIAVGALNTITATVSSPLAPTGPAPAGNLRFQLDGVDVSLAPLVPTGQPGTAAATFQYTPLTRAITKVTAVFDGDGSYLAEAASKLVLPLPGQATLSFVSPPSTYSCPGPNPLTLRLRFPSVVGLTQRTVELGSGTGAAFAPLLVGGRPLMATLQPTVDGEAQATLNAALPVVLTQLTARFTDDPNLAQADSTISLTMQKLPVTMLFDLPSNVTNPVTLTATVSSGPDNACQVSPPTGGVRFLDGARLLGAKTLDASGKASLQVARPSGSASIQAIYSGDSLWQGSQVTRTVTFQ